MAWSPADDRPPGPVLDTIEVDGELFALRLAEGGGTAYDWLTGPNKGYGFVSSMPGEQPREEHVEHIRAFLGMIDPRTGYIEDD
jgi:hypothetical protein